MNVEESLRQKKEAVERELEHLLNEEDSLMFRAMRYAVLSGGKRFRPLLSLSSGEYFGASRDTLLPFACALELIHNYSLVHDDLPLMDDDDFRRGQPSCHKAFGEDIALLAGDGLLTLAFEVIAQAPVGDSLLPRKEQVMKEISRHAGVKGMVGGQLMDISLSCEDLTEDTIHELMLKKTGGLITAAVKTGAILGGADGPELEAIVEYGRNIGMAFQVRDDIHDSGEEKQPGQPFRPNYVSLFGLETSKQRLKDFVEAARNTLKEASIDSEELHWLASKLMELKEKKGK